MKFCTNCGAQLKLEDKFCFRCGSPSQPLEGVTEATTVDSTATMTQMYVPAIVEEYKKAGALPDYYRISLLLNKIRETEPSKQVDDLQEIAYLYSRIDVLYHNLGIEPQANVGAALNAPNTTNGANTLEYNLPLANQNNTVPKTGSQWSHYAGLAAASFGGTFLAHELSRFLHSHSVGDTTSSLSHLNLSDISLMDHSMNSLTDVFNGYPDLGLSTPFDSVQALNDIPIGTDVYPGDPSLGFSDALASGQLGLDMDTPASGDYTGLFKNADLEYDSIADSISLDDAGDLLVDAGDSSGDLLDTLFDLFDA